jgi:hypothetical protein
MSDPLLPVGSNRCLCGGCGRYFSSVSAFDRHQTAAKDGTNACHDPATRGLVDDGRYWGWPPSEWSEKLQRKPVEALEAVEPALEPLARQPALL